MARIGIIGAGPAGISAALYAKRAGSDVVIFNKNDSALEKGHLIENYYGYESINGKELFEIGYKQALRLGAKIINEEVLSIEYSDKGSFTLISTQQKENVDILIIACGNNRRSPLIKGLKDKEGKGVSYCAVCDGFFYRKQKIAVIGNGDYAIHEATYLSNLSKDVCLYTNGKEVVSNLSLPCSVIKEKIISIDGETNVESITLASRLKKEVKGIFIAEGSASAIDFARKLGILVENNRLIVDEKMATNVEGIYACGDCTKGFMQIAKAVYQGALAATEALNYWRNKNKSN